MEEVFLVGCMKGVLCPIDGMYHLNFLLCGMRGEVGKKREGMRVQKRAYCGEQK